MKIRIAAGFCFLLCGLAALSLRLLWLSGAEKAQTAAELQSRRVLSLFESRGTIYDRNLSPLVNADETRMAAIFPELADYSELREFFGGEKAAEIMTFGEAYVTETDGRILYGAGIFNYALPRRYSENQPCAHVIGYLSEGSGAAGIEKAYDELLSSGTKTNLCYYSDGFGRLLSGEEISVEEETSTGKLPVLTIDKRIQEICEAVLKASLEKGAAVVLSPENGEILAAASLPVYDPENLAAALNDEAAPFLNRAFSAYPVGSVWKPITAAAALESGISPARVYDCRGSIKVDDRLFKCHWAYGHGEISMTKALEISCNPYFIDLAAETGGEKILELAKNLGFGSASELAEGLFSAKGNLPSETELSRSGALANFAFGQGSLSATPLQLAAAYCAFCNGGFSVTPTLIKGFVDKDGKLEENPPYARNPVLSADTAEEIRRMLVAVVEEGSGSLAAPRVGSAGGKTASAQTGIFDEQGVELVHAWFAGFYPAESPEYVIVVFAEGMNSGSEAAAPIFKGICDGISALR